MATFTLQPFYPAPPPESIVDVPEPTTLVRSAGWYTKVRWIAAAVFAAFGLLFLLPLPYRTGLGIEPEPAPMWLLAGLLGLGNIPFWLAARRRPAPPHRRVQHLLWGQIALDLLAVTYLVHSVGSVGTFISFFYLLHITLSCISLTRRQSLLVAVVSSLLYLATVILELTGLWPSNPIAGTQSSPVSAASAILHSLSAVFLWIILWYFVSTIADSLRKTEQRLRTANLQLTKADEEKTRIMVQTTHDLKSPFFGIEANMQLLNERWSATLSADARRIVERILTLSRTLKERIDAILLYNRVRSSLARPGEPSGQSDLSAVMDEVIPEVRDRANERNVSLEVSVPRIAVRGNPHDLTILFANLVSNAVSYSKPGQTVRIRAERRESSVEVVVQDEGIGIREDALPRIFDEYFRTKEATQLNHRSTGLGLAIVRQIAARYKLAIGVDSTEGVGTTFTVALERATE